MSLLLSNKMTSHKSSGQGQVKKYAPVIGLVLVLQLSLLLITALPPHMYAIADQSPFPLIQASYRRRLIETTDIATLASSRQPLPGVPTKEGMLPLLLGVGPAKTGTTALFRALGKHPSILTGNAGNKGQECCNEELYFFSRHWKPPPQAAKSYAAYFNSSSKPNAQYVAEKTPEYSDHLLAPYRVQTMLQTSAVKLLYTVRDPIDAHISLYFHRIQEKHQKSSVLGFIAWSAGKLDAHSAYQNCAQRVLSEAGFKPSSNKVTAQYEWIGVEEYDKAVFNVCRKKHYHSIDALEGVGSLMYIETFIRWNRVMKGSDGLCVFNEDLIVQPQVEVARVLEFLGVDSSSSDMVPEVDVSTFAPIAGEEKLHEIAETHKDPSVVVALENHLNRLEDAFDVQSEFVQQFCGHLQQDDVEEVMAHDDTEETS